MINNPIDKKCTLYPLFSEGVVFDTQESQKIIQQCLQLEKHVARTGSGKTQNDLDLSLKDRRSNVSWIPTLDESYKWIYNRMMDAIQTSNKEHFNFSLSGVQPIQFTVYDSKVYGEYDWHIDMDLHGDDKIRKLSISVPLSDPAEYEGGALLFLEHGKKIVVPTQKPGIGYTFASYTPHCVTPLISGTRYSLVMWAYGPRFI